MIKPFLKWPGGKNKLIPLIESLFPKNVRYYVDPFVGGGSTFLRFAELNPECGVYLINDLNESVITAYRNIHFKNDFVTQALISLSNNVSKEEFYRVRQFYNETTKSLVWSTAYFLYLNKTCFNGLFRVNSKGDYNVPYGHYKLPDVISLDRRKEVSALLNSLRYVIYESKDFEVFTKQWFDFSPEDLNDKSFVYLDPPYEPLVDKQSFTAYTMHGFDRNDQERLAVLCEYLDKRNVKFLLHNSNTPYILDRYKEFNIMEIEAPRSIARMLRDPAKEVIIRNY